MASASSLPDEIIIRVAECLIAPNQYAIPYQKLYWEEDKWPNLRMREFADKMAPGISPNHLSPSPVALAVFRPSLLAEFAKLLHKTAVFYFEDSDELFKYLERPGISQYSLEVRRTLRFIEFRVLVCSMWPLFERAQDLRTVFFAGPGKFGQWTLAPPDDFYEVETPREFHAILMSVLDKIIHEIERFPRKFPRVYDNKEEDVWEE
ncbi:hypothetical protein IWZ01DRAFT_551560 [Phyllosticta capitalensis]